MENGVSREQTFLSILEKERGNVKGTRCKKKKPVVRVAVKRSKGKTVLFPAQRFDYSTVIKNAWRAP